LIQRDRILSAISVFNGFGVMATRDLSGVFADNPEEIKADFIFAVLLNRAVRPTFLNTCLPL
tara:strand:+ start:273 stop:458 length:186 start_codon:yes stop_codon:yes gene_type:complete